MPRYRVLVPAAALAAAAGLWWRAEAPPPSPAGAVAPGEGQAAVAPGSRALAEARLAYQLDAVSAFVEDQRRRTLDEPGPEQQRVLAEALLERVLARDLHKGMRVGAFVSEATFAASRADIEEGLQLVRAARAAGDDSSESYRIEAGLLSSQLTGLGAVLANRSAIQEALDAALQRDPQNPRAHVALGCRKLLVPAWLGQDIDGALEHFEQAAGALVNDERPQVLAAFAHYLGGRLDRCRDWLRRAAARNPQNRFVQAVLVRLDRGDSEPFERDLQ